MDASQLSKVVNSIESNSVKVLNLQCNNLGGDHIIGIITDVVAIAEALKENTSLKAIQLSYNPIGDEGARAIAEALKINSSLQEIRLSNNLIGEQGGRAIAEAVKVNSSLQEIYLTDNPINDEVAVAMADALKINSSLQTIWLSNTLIGDDGARAIAEALKVNTRLREIAVCGSFIGIKGGRAIVDAMKHNTSVAELDLSMLNFEIGDLNGHDKILYEIDLCVKSNRIRRECIKQLRRSAVTMWLAFRSMALPSPVMVSLVEFLAHDEINPVIQVLSENERLQEVCKIMKFSNGESQRS